MPTVAGYPLLDALSKVSDFRKSRGRRHPLVAILALGCVAVLCGASSLTAISQWAEHHDRALLTRLGFTHCSGPSVATLHRVLSKTNAASLAQTLSEWLRHWCPAAGCLALDGKTARGSTSDSGRALQVLSAFATQARLVVAQCAIANYDEVGAALALLEGLDLHGWIITGDAKFTQKAIVEKIIERGGDYVLTVKDNQPTLREDIRTLFSDLAVVADTVTTSRRVDLHSGRLEVRTLCASTALTADYCGWAGLQQVFRIERQRLHKRTGVREESVDYGITSLPAARADAQRLAAINRGHWGIENRLHWVRDVDFAEDASRIRTGEAPQVMICFRNVALGLLALLGYDSPIEGLRHFAWNSEEAVKIVTGHLRKAD